MKDNRKVMAKFLKPFNQRFTGTDLEPYGPFDEGDIVRLPADNAEVLESRGFIKQFGAGNEQG